MEKVTYRLFLFLLIFPPLAFGTVEQWSLTLMEALCFLATFTWVLLRLVQKKPIYHAPGLFPLLLFLGYLIFQVLPLPALLIRILSPNGYTLYQETVGITDPTTWYSLSINKKVTLKEFFRYASYVCFYFLTVQILTNKQRLQKTVNVVVVFLSFLALFAIIQKLTSTDTIYWLWHVPDNSIIFGPYVNHNHFAGLVEMILPISISLFILLKPKGVYQWSFREKIIEIFDLKKGNLYILMGFSTVILAMSIVFSLSRGALIAICLALTAYVVFLVSQKSQKKRGILVFLFMILIVLFIGWFGWESMFERFNELENEQGVIYEARLDFWKDSLNIIKNHPITGIGFGNFGGIYPSYRTYSGSHTILHSHNDYLELLIEGGIIGFLLVGWFLFQLLYKSVKTFRKRKEPFSSYLFLGCSAGLLSIWFHSFTDFNLHIGANGLYYFFLLGLLVSAANTKLRNRKTPTLLERTDAFWPRLMAAKVTMAALVVCLVFNVGILIGDLAFSAFDDVYLSANMPDTQLEKWRYSANRASHFDPMEGKYHFAKANLAVFTDKENAQQHYEEAIYHRPLSGEYLQKFGLYAAWLSDFDKADRLLKAGIRNDISNPKRYRIYSEWLFSINRKEEAIEYLTKALSLENTLGWYKVREYIIFMALNEIDEDKMLILIPPRLELVIGLADYFVNINKIKTAEMAYLKALTLVNKKKESDIWIFFKAFEFYEKLQRYDDALKILLQATTYFPENIQAKTHMADIYRKQGMIDEAIVEYKRVLSIDPNNESVRRRLGSITQN